MKKAFFLIAVLFLFVSVAWTRENSEQGNSTKENPQRTSGLNFTIEPTSGMRFGKEGEIVWYEKSTNRETYKLSELEWEYMPAWYLGSNFLLNYNRFEISFLSKFFLPVKCGIMKDSDWQQDFIYKTGNTSTKTNYSESENNLEYSHDLELLFAMKFYPTNFMTLRPRISVNYQRMHFDAKGGTLWYGNDINGKTPYEQSFTGSYYAYNSKESIEAKLKDTSVIEYKTHNLYLWTGIQADFIPTRKLVLSLATEISPLMYILSYDSHILRNLEYKQYSLSLFYALRQSSSVTFNVNNFLSLSLNCIAVLTFETTGPSYTKTKKQSSYERDGKAGGYSRYIDIGISAKFSF